MGGERLRLRLKLQEYKLSSLFYMGTNPIVRTLTLMTLSKPNYLPKALSPVTITFWGKASFNM